jgi:hypothetical protein
MRERISMAEAQRKEGIEYDARRAKANQEDAATEEARAAFDAAAIAKQAADAKRLADLQIAEAERVKQARISTGLDVLSTVESLASQEVALRGRAAMGAVILAKAAGASQILISGAIASAKALELGPFIGPPAAFIVGGLALAQAAKVATAPIPEPQSFATGYVPPTKGGERLAYLGEEEAVLNSRGRRTMGDDTIQQANMGRVPTVVQTWSIDGAKNAASASSRFVASPRRAEEVRRAASSGDLGTTGRAVYR